MIKSFITDTGILVPAITGKQMIEIDRIATERTGPNLFEMMENAGRNLAIASMEILGNGWQKASIVLLAGTGGNGGGGICATRHLANRNINVKLCITNDHNLKNVTSFQRKIFKATSGKEISIKKLDGEKPDLIIDAVIGYDLKSAPIGNAQKMIKWTKGQSSMIISLDVPSGADATTGETPGEFVPATQTVTLALPKTGLLKKITGELFLADIGIPEAAFSKIGIKYSYPFDKRFLIPITGI